MTNGRLNQSLIRRDGAFVRADVYVYAQVYRGRRGSETVVGDFQARIAAVSASALSRDQQAVIGDSAAQVYVISAPLGSPVQKGDEIWTGTGRYRVIAVDILPGEQQVIAQSIQ